MHDTYQSPEITELAKALLAVQAQLQPALKDAENIFTKSSYATLNSAMDTCRGALIANGIWMTQFPVPPPDYLGGGYLGLITKFTHAESGQWQASLAVVPLPKADPQGMGSAMTYARRYALCAMLGIVTEDDDGEGAKAPKPVKKSRTSPQEPTQIQETPLAQENTHGLPKIDGIIYQTITATDGRRCIVATGNTQPKKEMLMGIGFKAFCY
jgi:hypothetical protein